MRRNPLALVGLWAAWGRLRCCAPCAIAKAMARSRAWHPTPRRPQRDPLLLSPRAPCPPARAPDLPPAPSRLLSPPLRAPWTGRTHRSLDDGERAAVRRRGRAGRGERLGGPVPRRPLELSPRRRRGGPLRGDRRVPRAAASGRLGARRRLRRSHSARLAAAVGLRRLRRRRPLRGGAHRGPPRRGSARPPGGGGRGVVPARLAL